MQEKIRLVKNLLEKRKARQKEGLFVVEGPHLVKEAAKQVKFVLYSENLPLVSELTEQDIECCKISKKQFAELSEVKTPQGILAVVKQEQYDLQNILEVKNPLIVFCLEIQDPGNLGTIIRTADAVGASGVILSRGTVDLYNPKVIRSTMGSLFHLPIMQDIEINQALETLKAKGLRVIATDTASTKSYFDIKYTDNCAIVIGNEGAGLAEDILDLADETVNIPMPGKAESLNVGISTAVVLYEALRQRIK